jgi:hypothetical protein
MHAQQQQQLHRCVFKPLRQAAQGSTELTRSLRNSLAHIVLVAFGVVNSVSLSKQSKRDLHKVERSS